MNRSGTAFLALLVACAVGGASASRSQDPPAQGVAAALAYHPVEVPVGGIIVWWGMEKDVPKNFEVCDGRLVATPGALLSGRKPDLRDRFVKGTPIPSSFRPESFKTGGSNTLALGKTGGTALTLAHMPSTLQTLSHQHPFPHQHTIDTDEELKHHHGLGGSKPHKHSLSWSSIASSNGPLGSTGTSQSFLYLVSGQVLPNSTGTPVDAGGSTPPPPTEDGWPEDDPSTKAESKYTGTPSTLKTGDATAIASTGSDKEHEHPLPANADNQPAFLEVLFIIRVK